MFQRPPKRPNGRLTRYKLSLLLRRAISCKIDDGDFPSDVCTTILECSPSHPIPLLPSTWQNFVFSNALLLRLFIGAPGTEIQRLLVNSIVRSEWLGTAVGGSYKQQPEFVDLGELFGSAMQRSFCCLKSLNDEKDNEGQSHQEDSKYKQGLIYPASFFWMGVRSTWEKWWWTWHWSVLIVNYFVYRMNAKWTLNLIAKKGIFMLLLDLSKLE